MTDITKQRQRRHVPHAELIPHRGLAAATMLLGLGVAANAVLGPFILEVIDYRFSTSLVNQGIGLDAVALCAVFPVAVVASILMWRARHVGLVLAFIPSTFAIYMLPQYVIGPEYLRLSGNNEQFFPFHLALFVLAMGVFLFAWNAVEDERLRPHSRPSDRMRAMVLVALAGFIFAGRWLPALVELVEGTPSLADFRVNPTSFLLIGWLDLGIVVPAAIAAAIGSDSCGALAGRERLHTQSSPGSRSSQPPSLRWRSRWSSTVTPTQTAAPCGCSPWREPCSPWEPRRSSHPCSITTTEPPPVSPVGWLDGRWGV